MIKERKWITCTYLGFLDIHPCTFLCLIRCLQLVLSVLSLCSINKFSKYVPIWYLINCTMSTLLSTIILHKKFVCKTQEDPSFLRTINDDISNPYQYWAWWVGVQCPTYQARKDHIPTNTKKEMKDRNMCNVILSNWSCKKRLSYLPKMSGKKLLENTSIQAKYDTSLEGRQTDMQAEDKKT